jgi:acetyltransferase-like isoleucine patch superfamily enzyme
MGRRCSVNPFSILLGIGGLKIGDFVRIAGGTVIAPGNHVIKRIDIPICDQGMDKRGITIDDDVWVGANCVITDGVHVNTGAVLSAGSVVTSDVPSRSIVAGVPAKVIKYRG